jgi:hypothetical protein
VEETADGAPLIDQVVVRLHGIVRRRHPYLDTSLV